MNIAVNKEVRTAPAPSERDSIRIVIVGHVDHGKSTLIGRLLHETGSLAAGKLESLKAMAARRGMQFEWSFLLDALQTERDQGITIDTSQIRFRTPARDILLIDAPGHAEFLRNMITGAAQADAALLIVDAVEGIRDQTRRHAYMLQLLGVRQIAVVINKMDRINFDRVRFASLKAKILAYLTGLGLNPASIIPISARTGDGISRRTESIAWHKGPTVLEALDQFRPTHKATELPFRMPVQAIYKFDDRRILAGRVESGVISIGDAITIAPDGKLARVKTIERWPVPDKKHTPGRAIAGQSIGITLDQEIFIERGSLAAPQSAPPLAGHRLRARVFWLGRVPLEVGVDIVARVGTADSRGTVTAIVNGVDPGALTHTGANTIDQNHVGEVEILLSQPLAGDPYTINPAAGRVVIEFDGRIAGGGLILSLDDGGAVANAQRVHLTTGNRASCPKTVRNGLVALAARLAPLMRDLLPVERLKRLREEVDGRIVFTTSFGLEDQAIAQMICENDIDVDLITLDTGRLFSQTYDLWAETERRFGRRIQAVYPLHDDIAALIKRQGINGFYESREARLACCYARKVEPLGRALAGTQAWITGLRSEQSAGRRDMVLIGADTVNGVIKLNPLFDWSRDAVKNFVTAKSVPVNPLHAKGFASIGCAPCTCAIAPGEPERAGRWWWEEQSTKECGLHRDL
jgi:phosphoadenylyl-sulfate reductase (thioredoxin)